MSNRSSPSGGNGNNNRTRFGYSKPKKPKPRGLVLGFTDALVKGAKVDRKKRKEADINEKLLGTPDYQGDVKRPKSIKEVLDEQAAKDQRDRDPNPNPSDYKDSVKSKEQPKVASQMDNSGVKSDLIDADKTAPTDIEMSEDEKLLRRKRGRKTKTVLTSVTGDNTKATLSKKTLLGV
jgi:hypothetical protein